MPITKWANSSPRPRIDPLCNSFGGQGSVRIGRTGPIPGPRSFAFRAVRSARSSLTPARPQEQKGHTLGASDAGRRNSRPRLQREQEASPYVFTSERGGPISAKSFGTLFKRLGKRAGMPLHHLPAHAAPRLRLRPGECGPRHAGAAGMARAQEHPAHGALHRAGAGSAKNESPGRLCSGRATGAGCHAFTTSEAIALAFSATASFSQKHSV
jgi:hypothetical protein